MGCGKALSLLILACGTADRLRAAAAPDFFQKSIQPFLAKNCLGCHSSKLKVGGLDLESYKTSASVTDAGLLANVARFGRRVRLWRNDAIGAPVTWGIVRPIILVPAGFEALPAESRDAVIRHELAHIQVHDFLMRCLAEIARALIWFQPLVWIVHAAGESPRVR